MPRELGSSRPLTVAFFANLATSELFRYRSVMAGIDAFLAASHDEIIESFAALLADRERVSVLVAELNRVEGKADRMAEALTSAVDASDRTETASSQYLDLDLEHDVVPGLDLDSVLARDLGMTLAASFGVIYRRNGEGVRPRAAARLAIVSAYAMEQDSGLTKVGTGSVAPSPWGNYVGPLPAKTELERLLRDWRALGEELDAEELDAELEERAAGL